MNSLDGVHEHQLLVFVGYANDAEQQARCVKSVQTELQTELNHRLGAGKQTTTPFASVEVYLWGSHAPRQTGGQSLIDSAIDRANMAVFVFKNRVGAVTWQELDRCRGWSKPCVEIGLFMQ